MKQATLVTALALALVSVTPSPGRAGVITIATCLHDACPAFSGTGTPPGVLVSFVEGDSGTINFTITNNTNGYIDDLDLFYKEGLPTGSAIAPSSFAATGGDGVLQPILRFSATSGGPATPWPLVVNFAFDFSTSNSGGGSKRFNAGEVVTFTLGPGLVIADLFDTVGRAHINEVGGSSASAWIGTGTPSTGPTTGPTIQTVAIPDGGTALTLLGGALLGLAALRRKL